MRVRLIVAVLAAVSLVGTACASDSEEGAGAGGDTGQVSGDGSTGSIDSGGGGRYDYGSTGSTGSTGATGGTGSGGSADLTVTAVNYQFDPSRITVDAGGSIEVRDTNPQTPHTFTVKGTDIDVGVDPQSSEMVKIDLEPGTYDVVCRFHAESQGMTATLTVE